MAVRVREHENVVMLEQTPAFIEESVRDTLVFEPSQRWRSTRRINRNISDVMTSEWIVLLV